MNSKNRSLEDENQKIKADLEVMDFETSIEKFRRLKAYFELQNVLRNGIRYRLKLTTLWFLRSILHKMFVNHENLNSLFRFRNLPAQANRFSRLPSLLRFECFPIP
jgi:hypothetical protein